MTTTIRKIKCIKAYVVEREECARIYGVRMKYFFTDREGACFQSRGAELQTVNSLIVTKKYFVYQYFLWKYQKLFFLKEILFKSHFENIFLIQADIGCPVYHSNILLGIVTVIGTDKKPSIMIRPSLPENEYNFTYF